MEAVKQNGMALEFVKDQTENICMEAVKQCGFALKFVKDQTEKICIRAVKQNCSALPFINDVIRYRKLLKKSQIRFEINWSRVVKIGEIN
jgi:sporulation protein YlmC with PRC-barrel domain